MLLEGAKREKGTLTTSSVVVLEQMTAKPSESEKPACRTKKKMPGQFICLVLELEEIFFCMTICIEVYSMA